MKRVYIFGPIYLFGKSYLPIYRKLNRVCKKYFDRVIGTYPDFWNSKEAPKDFYKRTYKTITKCDLFIAEVSSPSHGVGMELQMAQEYNIPIIVLVKRGINFSKSTMVLGLPNLRKVIYYNNSEELENAVDKEVRTFLKVD